MHIQTCSSWVSIDEAPPSRLTPLHALKRQQAAWHDLEIARSPGCALAMDARDIQSC